MSNGLISTVQTVTNNSSVIGPKAQTMPFFSQELKANDTIFSPQNQDGYRDNIEFSFTPSIASTYNFTIEEDAKMVDYKALSVSIAGNESILHMVYTDVVNSQQVMYYRNSTDNGFLWSTPIATNIIGSEGVFQLDLEVNETDGTLLLLATHCYYAGQYDISLFNSTNGITWGTKNYRIDDIIENQEQFLKGDMLLSNDKSTIFILLYQWDTEGIGSPRSVWILNSSDGGESFNYSYSDHPDYDTNPCGIAQSPVDGTLTAIYWTNNYFYVANSINNGLSWSGATILTIERGIGPVNSSTPYDGKYIRMLQIQYDSEGILHGYMVYNITSLYTLQSSDNGQNWENMTELRKYQSGITDLTYLRISQDKDIISFRSDFSGSAAGSSYFMHPHIVKSSYNQNTNGISNTTIIWDGKDDESNYVQEGTYVGRVWLKDQSDTDINSNPSTIRFDIDNTSLTYEPVTTENSHFSPQNSPGIKDTTSISFTPNKNTNYEFNVRQSTGISTSGETYRVTDHTTRDYSPDIVMDEDFNIYTVYVGSASGDPAIYLKVANEYSFTFGTPSLIISSPGIDDVDQPTIAYYNNTLWLVFMKYHSSYYDFYITNSTDKGLTWSTPVNITDTEHDLSNGYYNPDLLITEDGIFYVGYSVQFSDCSKWQTMNSTDGGKTFSIPQNITISETSSSSYNPPISIEYIEETNMLYAAVGNWKSSGGFMPQIFNSSDGGATWTLLGEIWKYSNHYIYGISLFYVGEGLFKLDYYGDSSSKFIFHFDFWTSGSYIDRGSIYVTLDTTYPYKNCLRSGKSPYGDYMLIYSCSGTNPDVYVRSRAKIVYQETGTLFKNTPSELTWDGSTFWGDAASSNYTIQVNLRDELGFTGSFEKNCTLDNYIQDIDFDFWNMNLTTMDPKIDQKIYSESYYNSPPFDFEYELYYHNDSTSVWTHVPMIYNISSYRFELMIPGENDTNEIFFYGNVSDQAGNTYITPIYSFLNPQVGYTINDLTKVLLKSSWDPFDLTVQLTANSKYVESIYVVYNTGEGDVSVNMTAISKTYYILPTISHVLKLNAITYSLRVNYTNGKIAELYSFPLVSPNLAFSVFELSAASTYDDFDMKVRAVYGKEYVNGMYVIYSYNQTSARVDFNNETSPIFILPTINITDYIPTINYLVFADLVNGSQYLISNITLLEPAFTLGAEGLKVEFTSMDSSRKLDDTISFAVGGLETKYIDKMYIDYALNGESEFKSEEMSLVNGSTYSYELPGSKQNSQLEYQIRLVDIKSKTHILRVVNGSEAIIQDYVPPMPQINLSSQNRTIIALISGSVGAAVGLFLVVNQRKNSKHIQERFMSKLHAQETAKFVTNADAQSTADNKPMLDEIKNKSEIAEPLSATENNVEFKMDDADKSGKKSKTLARSRTSYIITSLLTYSVIGATIYTRFILENGGFSLFFATIAIIFSTYILVEQMLIDISEGIYNGKKTRFGGILFHVIITAGSLVLFILSGQIIDWFNYYVIQQTVTVGPIAIPQLWLSLFSVFITSVVLVIVSTYKDLKTVIKRFEILELTRASWKVIWQQKEENAGRLKTNANIKTLVFLATVFVSVITTTQLGQYAEFGLYFLVPAIAILVVVLLFEMVFGKRTQTVDEALSSWLIEKTKFCPKCQTVNLFDNIYCIKCKHPFALADVVVEKTIRCEKCENISPEESDFCRYCGEAISPKQ